MEQREFSNTKGEFMIYPRDLDPDSIYVSHDIGSIPLVSDPTLCPEPKLEALTILQDARDRLLLDKPFNNLAYWFLCDTIYYVIWNKR